ncbi:MAG: recombinase family protein [Chloroflexi bacterium]|nr:recombinase family protein [Chloroflexota bacterium]
MSKAQRQRAELGLHVGPVPFGYAHEDARQALEVVASEAEAVREAFERRTRGESYGSIAAWFNERGFQTRTGRMFTAYSVRDMLTTRLYTGIITYKAGQYPGKHEAIVPKELYEQVQLLRAKHCRKNTRGGITGALQGLLSCGHCENAIHSERNYHGDPRYRERHGWPYATNGRTVIARNIDSQIGEVMAGIELASEWRDRILQLATNGGFGMDIAALKKQRQRIARAYGDGAYTDEEYERRLAEIDANIQLAIPVMLPSVEEAAELINNLPRLWQEALPDERRRLVGPLIDRVYLDLKSKRISGIRPRPGFGELLVNAVRRTTRSTCVLLSQEETAQLQNVGMVETGEN